MRQVEEALARQTLYGGDVVTNLLDVAPPPETDEAALTAALAEAMGLPAAPLGALPEPDSAVVARVGRGLAEQHGFVPIAIRGGAIVIALAEPLAKSAVEEIESALGASIVQQVAPMVRLQQALEHIYGVPMDRRVRRLAAILDGESPANTSVPPPRRSLIPDVSDAPAHAPPREPAKEAERPPEPPAQQPADAPAVQEAAGAPAEPTPTPTPSVSASRGPPPTTIRSARAGTDALRSFVKDARGERSSGASKRRRGPFTRADAEKVFADPQSTDAVLGAALEFAQQWFAYVAMFLVHDDLAEGWDAGGGGASGDRLRKMGVPLDLPSLFAEARETRASIVRARPHDGLDAVIAADLERPLDGDVVVAPVVVGKRVVALLYADDAGEPISPVDVAEVFAVVAQAGAALARRILRKKGVPNVPLPKRESAPPREIDPDVVAQRAGVLAKALAGARASSRPPPERAPAPEPRVRAASLEPIVRPTTPTGIMRDEPTPTPLGALPAAAATGAPAAPAKRSEPPRSAPDAPTGIALERTPSSDDIPGLRLLESSEPQPLALPTGSGELAAPATPPTPPTPVARPMPAAPVELVTRQAPPPNLTGRKQLGPPIPREEPEERRRAGQTSEPELIESAEVSDDEVEELLELDRGRKPLRPSERFEVYTAREPPRPTRRSAEHELPKVIVAIESEHVALVGKAIRGSAAAEEAAEKLRALGVAALPAIMDRFPGPTRVDRTTPITQVPRPSDAGPLLSLLCALGRLGLRDVLARTGDPLPETRFWATWLLTEVVDAESAPLLVPRVVDDDLAVRRAAWAASRALLEAEPATADILIEPLVGVILDPGGGMSLRIRSANALGELRDRRAVEGLVFGVDVREAELASACHEALVTITRADPPSRGQTWASWLAQHGAESRIEWLIDALLSESATLREAAGAELKATTKVYVGYYANLPRAEREEAWRRYRAWWKEEGSRKFAGR
ncbi:MAG: hypothetical protein HYV09_09790 [Deltaproteobacteria bacterium]|nr:hypothetical protein [Deltaproteobacteria bacterium]